MNSFAAGGQEAVFATTLSDGPQPFALETTPGAIEAGLRFARGGGRTFLARQAVPYPFHITRPHYLDPALPDLATLYLQSASGGLYRGDRLSLSVQAAAGARAHVTSQAATVVHTTSSLGVHVETQVDVAHYAVLALTTDPYILFPGTELSVTTEVTLTRGATVILAEGYSVHDPAAREQPFKRLASSCRIQDEAGRVLLDERTRLDGRDIFGAVSPLGPHRAMGTLLVLGHATSAPAPARVEADLGRLGVLAGCSRLPNSSGWGVRLLAHDGGHLRRGLDQVFAIGFEAQLGVSPERRRK